MHKYNFRLFLEYITMKVNWIHVVFMSSNVFFSWAPLSPLPPACLLVGQSHFQSYTTVLLCLDNLACMWGHVYCVYMSTHVYTCIHMCKHVNTCVYTKHEQKMGYCFLKTVNYQMAKELIIIGFKWAKCGLGGYRV